MNTADIIAIVEEWLHRNHIKYQTIEKEKYVIREYEIAFNDMAFIDSCNCSISIKCEADKTIVKHVSNIKMKKNDNKSLEVMEFVNAMNSSSTTRNMIIYEDGVTVQRTYIYYEFQVIPKTEIFKELNFLEYYICVGVGIGLVSVISDLCNYENAYDACYKLLSRTEIISEDFYKASLIEKLAMKDEFVDRLLLKICEEIDYEEVRIKYFEDIYTTAVSIDFKDTRKSDETDHDSIGPFIWVSQSIIIDELHCFNFYCVYSSVISEKKDEMLKLIMKLNVILAKYNIFLTYDGVFLTIGSVYQFISDNHEYLDGIRDEIISNKNVKYLKNVIAKNVQKYLYEEKSLAVTIYNITNETRSYNFDNC